MDEQQIMMFSENKDPWVVDDHKINVLETKEQAENIFAAFCPIKHDANTRRVRRKTKRSKEARRRTMRICFQFSSLRVFDAKNDDVQMEGFARLYVVTIELFKELR